MKPSTRENTLYSQGKENSIAREEQIMFSLLPEPKGTPLSLLDIGCGTGTIGLELRKRGFEVTGLDFSEVAVTKAKEKGIKALVCDVDEKGLPFPDKTFDVVWAGDIIEHVFDPIFLFKEAQRVLKKDGVMLLSTPNDLTLAGRTKIFLFGTSPQLNVYKKLQQYKHHTLFSWGLLHYMFSQAGFSLKKFHSLLRFPGLNQEYSVTSIPLGILFGRIFILKIVHTD